MECNVLRHTIRASKKMRFYDASCERDAIEIKMKQKTNTQRDKTEGKWTNEKPKKNIV